MLHELTRGGRSEIADRALYATKKLSILVSRKLSTHLKGDTMVVFKEIGYDTAHEVVSRNPNLYWDGWDILEWKKDADAFFNKKGLFRNGSWGRVVRKTSVSDNGTWKVPAKYVMGK
jgi:hypothetical protein